MADALTAAGTLHLRLVKAAHTLTLTRVAHTSRPLLAHRPSAPTHLFDYALQHSSRKRVRPRAHAQHAGIDVDIKAGAICEVGQRLAEQRTHVAQEQRV